MLNVLYIRGPDQQSEYLDSKVERFNHFYLTEANRDFIKDLLLLLVRYIDFVLIEEEYHTVTMAKLLNNCAPEIGGGCKFIDLVEFAIQNQDRSLTVRQIGELKRLLNKIRPSYTRENVLVALQTIYSDSMINPRCSCITSNLLNLAIMRCNSHSDNLLNKLYNELCTDTYNTSVLPEFSERHEELLKHMYDEADELHQYVYEKYNTLPECVKNKVEQYDFQICLAYELFADEPELRKLGTTHISDRKIRVWLERNKVAIDLSCYHELGHVVDYVFGEDGLRSQTDDAWSIIYDMDKDIYLKAKLNKCPDLKLLHEYAVLNATEYFASAFAEYIQNPKWMEETIPDTYYYMSELLQVYENQHVYNVHNITSNNYYNVNIVLPGKHYDFCFPVLN